MFFLGNGTFWPLFHSMSDRAVFSADSWEVCTYIANKLVIFWTILIFQCYFTISQCFLVDHFLKYFMCRRMSQPTQFLLRKHWMLCAQRMKTCPPTLHHLSFGFTVCSVEFHGIFIMIISVGRNLT